MKITHMWTSWHSALIRKPVSLCLQLKLKLTTLLGVSVTVNECVTEHTVSQWNLRAQRVLQQRMVLHTTAAAPAASLPLHFLSHQPIISGIYNNIPIHSYPTGVTPTLYQPGDSHWTANTASQCWTRPMMTSVGDVLISLWLPTWACTTEYMTHGQCDVRPTVTFPSAGHHCPVTGGTNLYCLITVICSLTGPYHSSHLNTSAHDDNSHLKPNQTPRESRGSSTSPAGIAATLSSSC